MRATARWLFSPALVLGWLIAGTTALGMLVSEVQDRAGFFSPAAIEKANKLIKEIHRDFKQDLVIETYAEPPSGKVDEFKKASGAERVKLFSEWATARAKALEVRGVYLLLCKEPGRVQIEVSDATQRQAFTADNRKRLDEIFATKFREAKKANGDAEKRRLHDQALIEGCEYVGKIMRTNGAGKFGRGEPADSNRAASPGLLGGGLGGLICMGLVALLIVWVLVALIRAFTGAARGGYGGGPGYGGGGGGGFMSGLLGGMFGAAAGSFLYDRFFHSGSGGWGGSSAYGAGSADASAGPGNSSDAGTGYSGGGSDFDDNDAGTSGGDYSGGGSDFDGGDSGGGDYSGGGSDFGGGDFGGGGGDF